MAERPLRTTPQLLLKIAQCLVHASDYLGERGDAEDLAAALVLWSDPEVVAWIARLHELGLVDLKDRPASVKQSR